MSGNFIFVTERHKNQNALQASRCIKAQAKDLVWDKLYATLTKGSLPPPSVTVDLDMDRSIPGWGSGARSARLEKVLDGNCDGKTPMVILKR